MIQPKRRLSGSKTSGQALGAESASWLTASGQWSSVLHPQGNESYQQPMHSEETLSFRSELQPSETLSTESSCTVARLLTSTTVR